MNRVFPNAHCLVKIKLFLLTNGRMLDEVARLGSDRPTTAGAPPEWVSPSGTRAVAQRWSHDPLPLRALGSPSHSQQREGARITSCRRRMAPNPTQQRD